MIKRGDITERTPGAKKGKKGKVELGKDLAHTSAEKIAKEIIRDNRSKKKS